jgi:hypothetical protein
MPSVVDARGKRHRVYKPSLIADKHDPAIKAAADSWAVAKKDAKSKGIAVLIGYLGFVVTMSVVPFVIPHSWLSHIPLRVASPLLYVLVFVYSAIVLWWLTRRRWAIAVRQMRSRGLCPACGYMIGNTEHEPDEPVICPECGGAWGRFDVQGRTVIVVREGRKPPN